MNESIKENAPTIQDIKVNDEDPSLRNADPYEIKLRNHGKRGGVFDVCLHPNYQELAENRKRYINPQAIVNFGFTLQAAWEASAASFQFSLLNGDPASLVYGSIVAGIGSTAIALSLAEMASL